MAALHVLFVLQLWAGGFVGAAAEEMYSQNAICRQHNCINPLFPGLNDLPRLEQIVWQCTTHHTVKDDLEFCKDAVMYDPALPSPNSTSQKVSAIVRAQDDAAATMFFYHLSGLGYEPWDHPKPATDSDECVRSVWSLVCFTYFPKVQAGCKPNQATPYLRPCSSGCEQYLATCAVECCDESARCVFQRSVGNGQPAQSGYVSADGPSALCTGSGARRRAGGSLLAALLPLASLLLVLGGERQGAPAAARPRAAAPAGGAAAPAGRGLGLGRGALLAVALACGLVLQGCDMDVPQHQLGNWRAKSDYLVRFEYLPPGAPVSAAQLNSCMAQGQAATEVCSGRGFCREWNPDSANPSPLSFCVCDRDYADPECRTRRRSQLKAFMASLFGGFLGIDYFYLGYPLWGVFKLLTLGGFGFWWLVDIVRTGSGPVYAQDFRVANDLPHWVFVLVTVAIFGLLGFFFSIESYLSYRKRKREDVMKLQETEETRRLSRPDEMEGPRLRMGTGPRSFDGRRDFSGYGSTLPPPYPNAGAPFAGPPLGPPGMGGGFQAARA